MANERSFVLSPTAKRACEPLLRYLEPERSKDLKELVINRPGQVGLEHMSGEWEFINDPALTHDALYQMMNILGEATGQAFNVANPILSCRLPGGHRAQFVAGQQNARQFSLCVRIAHEREFSLDAFDISAEDKQAIIDAVTNKKTVLISGGTGSGKTTFMNALIKYIPDDERLVTIEDVAELKVPQENVCQFLFANFAKSQNDDRQSAVNELLNACLRMRPDRILLGEIRKENAFTFCSAINTGHRGSMATIHANDPDSALDAVINRVLLNGDTTESAIQILRRQLVSDIYGVVQLERRKNSVHAYFKILDKN